MKNVRLGEADFPRFPDGSADRLEPGLAVFRVGMNDGDVVPVEALQQLDDGVSLLEHFKWSNNLALLPKVDCNKCVLSPTHMLILKCVLNNVHAWVAHAHNILMRLWSP